MPIIGDGIIQTDNCLRITTKVKLMTSFSNVNASSERADIAFFDPQHYEGFDSSIAQELAELLQKAYEQFDLFAADKKAKKPLEQKR